MKTRQVFAGIKNGTGFSHSSVLSSSCHSEQSEESRITTMETHCWRKPTPLPSTTRYARVHVPQGGEADTSKNKTIALEIQQTHHTEKKSIKCPLPWERGKPICRLFVEIGRRTEPVEVERSNHHHPSPTVPF